MSEEDLERYEAEIELALVQEYRTVLPLFHYVVETRATVLSGQRGEGDRARRSSPTCVELELDRRLGVGHVPPGALRAECQGPHLP